MKHSSIFFPIFATLFLCILMMSCAQEQLTPTPVLPQEQPRDPIVDEEEVEEEPIDLSDPCQGGFTFSVTYTQLASNLYPQYDFVIKITPTQSPIWLPNSPCGGIIRSYCITFNMPTMDFANLDLIQTNTIGPGISLPNNTPTPAGIGAAPLQTTLTTPLISAEETPLTVCFPPGACMVVGIKFNGPPPPGFTIANIITQVHGIATIDNIPDPAP